ncbi:hypothetical protein [Streptomyces venezuelae]|uniref:hypothetical protein n=1 Tax=Streptomyces venezuelae TaxID=54571 RepID=UPI0037CCF804
MPEAPETVEAPADAEATVAADDAVAVAVADAEVEVDADDADDRDDVRAAPARPALRQLVGGPRRVALLGAVVVLLLGGSAFFYGAHQLRTTASARNHALTDQGATARVGGDVGEGLARIFSYTPTSTDGAERSARTVLAGRAARQYDDLFEQVRASLVEQRITLTTQAVRTGVIELDGDDARLLVFLDQTSRRDKAAATTAAAQLTVTAKFQGDRWLIVDIKAR